MLYHIVAWVSKTVDEAGDSHAGDVDLCHYSILHAVILLRFWLCGLFTHHKIKYIQNCIANIFKRAAEMVKLICLGPMR